MKEKIIKELRQIDRKGINNLIEFLKESDFFTAPASVNHHLNWKKGLSIHSWHVKENIIRLHKRYQKIIPGTFSYDSANIEGLLHDVCKINKYKIDEEPATKKQMDYLTGLCNEKGVSFPFPKEKYKKKYVSKLIQWVKDNPNEPIPEYKEDWTYKDDNLPLGHGEKSVSIIQDFIELKDREKLAIRWHMSAWEDGVLNGDKNRDFNRARDLYPDVQLLQLADYEATFKEQYIPKGSD